MMNDRDPPCLVRRRGRSLVVDGVGQLADGFPERPRRVEPRDIEVVAARAWPEGQRDGQSARSESRVSMLRCTLR
jgi:hypothetical protein